MSQQSAPPWSAARPALQVGPSANFLVRVQTCNLETDPYSSRFEFERTDSWSPPHLEPGKWLAAVLTLFARAQQSASTAT